MIINTKRWWRVSVIKEKAISVWNYRLETFAMPNGEMFALALGAFTYVVSLSHTPVQNRCTDVQFFIDDETWDRNEY